MKKLVFCIGLLAGLHLIGSEGKATKELYCSQSACESDVSLKVLSTQWNTLSDIEIELLEWFPELSELYNQFHNEAVAEIDIQQRCLNDDVKGENKDRKKVIQLIGAEGKDSV